MEGITSIVDLEKRDSSSKSGKLDLNASPSMEAGGMKIKEENTNTNNTTSPSPSTTKTTKNLTTENLLKLANTAAAAMVSDDHHYHRRHRRPHPNNDNQSLALSPPPGFEHQLPAVIEPLTNHPRRLLFEKTLSASDVSSQNRLIIPRTYAEQYFPPFQTLHSADGQLEAVILSFVDKRKRTWLMRYEFWPASQSYVLTKGWRAFASHYELGKDSEVRFYELSPLLRRHNHYGIGFVRGVLTKTIRLFGKDCVCEYKSSVGGGDDEEDEDNQNNDNNNNGGAGNENVN